MDGMKSPPKNRKPGIAGHAEHLRCRLKCFTSRPARRGPVVAPLLSTTKTSRSFAQQKAMEAYDIPVASHDGAFGVDSIGHG
jgi:hypothetical protein